MERVMIHSLFPIVLLMHAYHRADAQAGTSSNPPLGFSLHDNLKASFSVMVVAFFSALVFMAIVSFYLRHCSHAYVATRNSIAAAANLFRRGVNRQVIDGCPILVYSALKDLKISKGTLECAVCLGEFQDYDRIRLLPKCHHVFHPDCIDAWLLSHMNCPVCRARLASADCGDNAVVMVPMLAENNNPTTRQLESGSSRHEIEQQRQQVVAAEPNNQRMDEEQSNAVTGSEEVAAEEAVTVTVTVTVTALERNPHPSRTLEVFPRSHSTGHSLQPEPVEENLQLDRHTLRLPEHVRKQILGNHNYRIWRSASSDGALPGAWSSKIACYRRDSNIEQLRLSMTPPFVPRGWGWGSVNN